ncbi:MAG: hypothetical protein ACERKZ_20275 [Lachnotalea sp.]
MQENKLSKEQIQALSIANQYGIINLDDMFETVTKMNESKILEEHKNFCEIWQATDGRWKTKLPDKTKKDGKRLIAKTSKAALEEMIIEWYKENNPQK